MGRCGWHHRPESSAGKLARRCVSSSAYAESLAQYVDGFSRSRPCFHHCCGILPVVVWSFASHRLASVASTYGGKLTPSSRRSDLKNHLCSLGCHKLGKVHSTVEASIEQNFRAQARLEPRIPEIRFAKLSPGVSTRCLVGLPGCPSGDVDHAPLVVATAAGSAAVTHHCFGMWRRFVVDLHPRTLALIRGDGGGVPAIASMVPLLPNR